ncbi:MAG: DUF192 domain-containing protein [Candidatus Staskawiczbacteria bacterium]|jgi:hypothetical protein
MKMILEIFFLIVIIIIIIFIFFNSANILLSPGTLQSINNKVCFKENCFSVEIAKTESERAKGLMNRNQLDADKGMLFIFEKEGVYPFWMKNTLIPLDIIWINENRKIIFIANNVQPCLPAGRQVKVLICPTVGSLAKAKYVLEVNAGIAENIKLKVGDTASLFIE